LYVKFGLMSEMSFLRLYSKNVLRSTALHMVSGYLEAIGKISIISTTVGITILITYSLYGKEISSLAVPSILYFVIALAICTQYMHIYEVGLQTIFLCFLIDDEHNKDFKNMRASDRLLKIIGEAKPPKSMVVENLLSVRQEHYVDQSQKKTFHSTNRI